MNEGQELVLKCGCHIFVDHEQGDRRVKCDHLNTWIIRAKPPVFKTEYTVELVTKPKVDDG